MLGDPHLFPSNDDGLEGPIWVVEGNCGDYYCEGNHVIGIYTTARKAEEAAGVARTAVHSYSSHPEPRRSFSTWSEVSVSRVTLDQSPSLSELR